MPHCKKANSKLGSSATVQKQLQKSGMLRDFKVQPIALTRNSNTIELTFNPTSDKKANLHGKPLTSIIINPTPKPDDGAKMLIGFVLNQ